VIGLALRQGFTRYAGGKRFHENYLIGKLVVCPLAYTIEAVRDFSYNIWLWKINQEFTVGEHEAFG
jgi:hypothetical protein